MAYEAVGPRRHELGRRMSRHRHAPAAAERESGPDRERAARDTERGAEARDIESRGRRDRRREPIPVADGDPDCDDEQQADDTTERRRPADSADSENSRRDEPNDDQHDP